MIPKIAWMHWEGPEMSWLRRRGLETFRQHNPDWELHVTHTPEDMALMGLCRAHEADWMRWKMLAKHGGLAIDTDVIHLRPIPDAWLDADLCAQTNSIGNVYQMAAIGGVPGNDLFTDLDRHCAGNAKRVSSHTPDPFDPLDDVYQDFGITALDAVISHPPCGPPQLRHESRTGTPNTRPASCIDRYGSVFRLSTEDLCYFNWDTGPAAMWSDRDPYPELPDTAVGVHWYGGAKVTKKHEADAHKNGPSWLERLASDS